MPFVGIIIVTLQCYITREHCYDLNVWSRNGTGALGRLQKSAEVWKIERKIVMTLN